VLTHVVRSHPSLRPRITAVTSATMLMLASGMVPVAAQAQVKQPAENSSPWSLSVGLGVQRAAEYEGAKKTFTGVAPDLNIGYKTKGWGSFAFGSKARGLAWTFFETEPVSLGLLVSGDGGRLDNKDGTVLRPGSKRLAGMGEIKPTVEVGLTGEFMLGVPLYFVLSKGLGDGKVNARNFSVDGHGGTRLELGADIPLQVSPQLTLSVSPSLVVADGKYMQTFFGVTAQQATRSGFQAFAAKRGIKSAGVTLGAKYDFDQHWSANAGVTLTALRGSAAKSPIVQDKSPMSIAAGFAYKF
jgi:MipA family protein